MLTSIAIMILLIIIAIVKIKFYKTKKTQPKGDQKGLKQFIRPGISNLL